MWNDEQKRTVLDRWHSLAGGNEGKQNSYEFQKDSSMRTGGSGSFCQDIFWLGMDSCNPSGKDQQPRTLITEWYGRGLEGDGCWGQGDIGWEVNSPAPPVLLNTSLGKTQKPVAPPSPSLHRRCGWSGAGKNVLQAGTREWGWALTLWNRLESFAFLILGGRNGILRNVQHDDRGGGVQACIPPRWVRDVGDGRYLSDTKVRISRRPAEDLVYNTKGSKCDAGLSANM